MQTMARHHVVVVGAGASGLMAAQQLEADGFDVVVVERADHVGGRMATRGIAGGRADVGAQFISVETTSFSNLVYRWKKGGLIFPWASDNMLSSMSRRSTDDQWMRYIAFNGMQTLAEFMAASVRDVRTGTEAVALRRDSDGWLVQLANDEMLLTQAVLLALPVPQALQIVERGGVTLSDSDREDLAGITYRTCVVGVFELDGEVDLPALATIKQRELWLADNQRKGISPRAHLLTVQAWGALGRPMFDEPDETAYVRLIEAVQPFLSPNATLTGLYLQRWPEAQPLHVHNDPCFVAEGVPPLVFAGDGFGRGRVEGAVLSGLAAADALADML